MNKRRFLPNFKDLVDRLSIHQLKEVFLPQHKEKYAKEMLDIQHDLDLLIKEDKIELTGEMLAAIIVVAQMNTHIWYNESKARNGEDQNLSLLRLTHGLNGIRNSAGNILMKLINQSEKQDFKIDCLAAEFKDWEVSLLRKKNED